LQWDKNKLRFLVYLAPGPLEHLQQELAVLEQSLKANISSPNANTVAFLNEALRRLREVPFKVDPARRINCLIDIASQFYHQGQSTFSAVEPAALAVMLARDVGDTVLLNRALNMQGIVLLSTNNPGDAIAALAEALDVAESAGDASAKTKAWVNLGTAFYEAALYADARDCAERATHVATGLPALVALKAVALGNVALYCMHMQEYEAGLHAIRDSIALRHAPDSPAEMLTRVFAEGTYTRLLLAVGRVAEAAERAQSLRSWRQERNRFAPTFQPHVRKGWLRCTRA